MSRNDTAGYNGSPAGSASQAPGAGVGAGGDDSGEGRSGPALSGRVAGAGTPAD